MVISCFSIYCVAAYLLPCFYLLQRRFRSRLLLRCGASCRANLGRWVIRFIGAFYRGSDGIICFHLHQFHRYVGNHCQRLTTSARRLLWRLGYACYWRFGLCFYLL